MSDIVERLRSAKTWLNEGECCGQIDASGTCAAPACIFGEALKSFAEAADEIERLRAEMAGDKILEDCEMHDPVWAAIAGVWGKRCEDFEEGCPCCRAWAEYDKVTRLTAEIEKLRAALQRIEASEDAPTPAWAIARRALLEGK